MKAVLALFCLFATTLAVDYVRPFGPEISTNLPTDDVTTLTDYCGDDATSYFEDFTKGNYRYVIISGAPSHDAEYDQENPNPHTRCERWQYAKMPLTWEDSGSNTRMMGADGFVMSGAVTFDHRAEAGDNAYTAWSQEGDTLDPSNGHSNAEKQYHYHAVPALYSSADDPTACEHIGYMLDGGKLYGRCTVDGVELQSCYFANTDNPEREGDYDYVYGQDGCQLDDCNMYTYNGETSYFISSNWPFVPPCMKGSVATVYGFTPKTRA